MHEPTAFTGTDIAVRLLELEKLWNRQPRLRVTLHGNMAFEGKLNPVTCTEDTAEVRAGFHSPEWIGTKMYFASKEDGPPRADQIVKLEVLG